MKIDMVANRMRETVSEREMDCSTAHFVSEIPLRCMSSVVTLHIQRVASSTRHVAVKYVRCCASKASLGADALQCWCWCGVGALRCVAVVARRCCALWFGAVLVMNLHACGQVWTHLVSFEISYSAGALWFVVR